MIRIKFYIVMALLAVTTLTANAQSNPQLQPLIQNVYGRNIQKLNGNWHYLLDMLETGYYDYRRQPTDNGFFKDSKVNDREGFKEYDFDSAPTMAIPGDWNTWEDRFLHYEGTMWFKRDFQYSDSGKRVYLYIGAANYDAKVYVNGEKVGEHIGGYTPFNMEVTKVLKNGKNNVCVKVDNKRYAEAVPTLNCDWFNFGGITRDVMLVELPQTYISSYRLQLKKGSREQLVGYVQLNGSQASQTVTVEVPQLKLKKQVTTDANGYAAIEMKAKPTLWSPENPYLYKVVTTVSVDGRVTDIYETVTGIRKVEFDADRGFLLNGKQLKLKGVNMHQDHAGVGSAIPEAVMEWRIRRLKEFGCNAYRSSHNPISPAMLDICDREGILVIDENRLTGINREHLRLLESMIRRDRNHPCVILWSNGNEEWGMENTVQGTRIAAAMREYARLMDPTRSSTIANAGGYEMIKGLEVVGYNYIAQNDVENRRRQHPEWKIVGTEETTGCGTRGVYFDLPDVKGRMKAINLGDKRNGVENVIERGWKFYADHEWAAGIFYWTGFDYRGEPNPLSYPATDSEFGILDYCGFWKDEAWYLKSWWTDEPTLHIFPHWNLKGHEGEEIEIWAYSNCDQVELTVNGKKLGRKDMPRNGHLKWKAVYQPGKVVATGYRNGKKILSQTIETTKPASKINVKSDRSVIKADGYDAAVITVEVLDPKNRIVPDACPELTLHVEGEAEIIGAGNGDPSYLGKDNPGQTGCKEFSIPAFNGLAQFIIRSGLTPGEVKLTCSSESLQSGILSVIGE